MLVFSVTVGIRRVAKILMPAAWVAREKSLDHAADASVVAFIGSECALNLEDRVGGKTFEYGPAVFAIELGKDRLTTMATKYSRENLLLIAPCLQLPSR